MSKGEQRINEAVTGKELRIIDNEGNQLGMMSAREALEIAYEKDLDLVEIAPNAKPPVCKIMDYGKYLFEQSKREKEAKKNQRVVEVKEVRMSSTIDTHDFQTKV
ncbi:MAG: translation initiation factor IF-3, partial [Ruminococcus sp.]|nr:translation initiation factor IF-3 [Ruminococcus sp.]